MRKYKLLYVESNKIICEKVRAFLNEHEISNDIDTVFNITDFLTKIKNESYDIILLSKKIFDINYIELNKLIEKLKIKTPLILLLENSNSINHQDLVSPIIFDYVEISNLNRLIFSFYKADEVYQLKEKLYNLKKESRSNLTEASLLYEIIISILQTDNLEEALSKYISTICPIIGWDVGHVFFPDKNKMKFISSKIWYLSDSGEFDEFKSITENIDFNITSGLAGEAWSKEKIIWIDDITKKNNFIRSKLCDDLKLKSAIAIPVIVNNEIIAVVEFFSREVENDKERFLKIFNLLGEQLSYFLEKKEALNHIYDLTNFDTLTQLPNRNHFNKKIKSLLKKHNDNKQNLALLVIDIDDFNKINDSLGHDFGDFLLKKITEQITNYHDFDYIARIGGDEIAIIQENITSLYEPASIASKIIALFKNPIYIKGREVHFSVSIGIAVNKFYNTNSNVLLKNADAALFNVKASEKGNYIFFTERLDSTNNRRILIENHLRHAIEKNELFLVYHPIINLKTKKISGVEVLLRWENSTLGAISPLEFITVAESTGVITKIGEWVIKQALVDYGTVIDEFKLSDFFLNINCSVVQFKDKNFLKFITDTFKNNNFNHNIFLEITETKLMENIDDLIKILNKIKKYGLKLAIDDFGTGYSSLSYLKRLPLSVLKIDKSFVDFIPDNKSDSAIVDAIIKLGGILGVDIIAEGVENIEQEKFLSDLSCQYVQGYLHSKPLTVGELKSFLLKNRVRLK